MQEAIRNMASPCQPHRGCLHIAQKPKVGGRAETGPELITGVGAPERAAENEQAERLPLGISWQRSAGAGNPPPNTLHSDPPRTLSRDPQNKLSVFRAIQGRLFAKRDSTTSASRRDRSPKALLCPAHCHNLESGDLQSTSVRFFFLGSRTGKRNRRCACVSPAHSRLQSSALPNAPHLPHQQTAGRQAANHVLQKESGRSQGRTLRPDKRRPASSGADRPKARNRQMLATATPSHRSNSVDSSSRRMQRQDSKGFRLFRGQVRNGFQNIDEGASLHIGRHRFSKIPVPVHLPAPYRLASTSPFSKEHSEAPTTPQGKWRNAKVVPQYDLILRK